MPSGVELEIILKLLLSALLGALVGFERERHRRPAGLRTNMLICIGATMFGLIPIHYFNSTSAETSRIWQNVLTGVGFLGAGAVFKEEGSVRGLTSAATIWAVAALGLAIAAGLYFLAVASEIIILITLFGLRRLEHYMGMRARVDRASTPPSDKSSR